ncbi:MAG: hypothetical protein ACE5F1_10270 [Planctomycetota bacterium]
MDSEKPELEGPPAPDGDPRLAELLTAHVVPEPSETFVDDTMLKISLDAWELPEPSPNFVDRVMRRLDEPAPRHTSEPQLPASARRHRRYVLPALLTAAALLLLFLLPELLFTPESRVLPAIDFGRASTVSWDRQARQQGLRDSRELLVPAVYYPAAPRPGEVRSARPTVVVR